MKLLLAVGVVILALFMSGCTKDIIKAGAERDAVLYGAQIELARTQSEGQRPACSFVATPGQTIAFSGIEKIECWGNDSGADGVEITQRVSPFWNFASQNAGILGILGWSAWMYPDGIGSGVQTITTPAPQTVRPEIVRPEVITVGP